MNRHPNKDEELARRAKRAFRDQERASLAEQGLADELTRKQDMRAKTQRLRELRLARDKALASAKARLAARASGKRQPK